MPYGPTPRRPLRPQSTWPSGDPRWLRLRTSLASSPVTPLPIVVTVGVNGIGITAATGLGAANVVGSVNPNGSATSWWVSYGTVLPLPGTATASTALGSGTAPLTVTFKLTGLAVGATYYVAVVGQSAAGTVYGQTIGFVVQEPVLTATQPIVPFGQPFVTIPHFNAPFTISSRNGTPEGAVVVEQDTTEEVLACVRSIVVCPLGACPQLPRFGIPIPTFAQVPVDATGILNSVQSLEPRAKESALDQFLADGTSWGINLTTSTASGVQA